MQYAQIRCTAEGKEREPRSLLAGLDSTCPRTRCAMPTVHAPVFRLAWTIYIVRSMRLMNPVSMYKARIGDVRAWTKG
jgi:hypothetical protein